MKYNHYVLSFATVAVVGLGGVGAYVLAAPGNEIVPDNKYTQRVIYIEQAAVMENAILVSNITGDLRSIEEDRHVDNEMIFLSPNRKYIAVVARYGDRRAHTYITNLDGTVVVPEHVGFPVSWAPDSSKVLLHLSIEVTGGEREIYTLDLQGNYEHTSLPSGTHAADISSKNGNIVYALTDSRSDDTDVYLRTPDGEDTLLIKGDGNIFAWLRFSPDGDKIAFLKSNLHLSADKNEVWLMSASGAEARRISNVAWSYPPAWSPDSTRLVFSDGRQIHEYEVTQDSLREVTNITQGIALHPTYTADGETIVYSDTRQIWSVRESSTEQLTTGDSIKLFPLTL